LKSSTDFSLGARSGKKAEKPSKTLSIWQQVRPSAGKVRTTTRRNLSTYI